MLVRLPAHGNRRWFIGVRIVGVARSLFFGVRFLWTATFSSARDSIGLDICYARVKEMRHSIYPYPERGRPNDTGAKSFTR